ncbi:MAG TPA: hypothetical protein VE127_13785, partial [Solirubrobacteraceae bacterium]|nr:hypothetical protein [Solirubrobacteraceae bacterium]
PDPAAADRAPGRPRRPRRAAELFERVIPEDPPTMPFGRAKRSEADITIRRRTPQPTDEQLTIPFREDKTMPLDEDATAPLGEDATVPLGEDATATLGDDDTRPLDR